MISHFFRPVRPTNSPVSLRFFQPSGATSVRLSRFGHLRQNATTSNIVSRQKPVQATSFAQRGRTPNKYPERLLIFHSPIAATAMTGASKGLTIIFFGVFGCMNAAPNMYFNPEMPLWMTPAVVVASAIPMILVSFLSAPFVASVSMRIPEWARKSKDGLSTFLRRLPPDTRLDFQKMGFLPLPRTRSMQLSELRPIKSRLLLANLEQVPRANAGKEVPGWLRATRGYLWTRPNATHWEKTLAPEVWPVVMEHIKRNADVAGAPREVSTSPPGRRSASIPARKHLPTPATALPRARPTRDVRPAAPNHKK